jgi:hypothetical protein
MSAEIIDIQSCLASIAFDDACNATVCKCHRLNMAAFLDGAKKISIINVCLPEPPIKRINDTEAGAIQYGDHLSLSFLIGLGFADGDLKFNEVDKNFRSSLKEFILMESQHAADSVKASLHRDSR